jgi:3-deoxy-7-phosphoheptulonate synthase
VDNKWYNLGAHFIWIGNRTRQIDHAHVEYFRGIQNPIGIKVGPKMPPLELIELINILNPDKIVGKITLITRYGAKNVANILPTHIKAIQQAGLQDVVLWSCDPMHGNTYKTENGYKTRAVESIVQELVNTFQCHLENGSRLGGIHVELTGENVTECVGGPQNLIFHDLEERYVTYCDPRLNYMQAMEVSFLVAGLLKTKTTGDEDDRLRDVNRVKRILNNNGGLKSRL